MSEPATDKIIMFCVIGLVAWAIVGLPILYAPSSTAASIDECIYQTLGICFVTATPISGNVFGFAEFVHAFVLLVLVYTVLVVRYRFRLATAPLPLWQIAFWMSAAIGVGTLVTDFWFIRNFPVPWFLANQAYWQFVLGLMFLAMVLIWLWFAFVWPPVFGKHNAL